MNIHGISINLSASASLILVDSVNNPPAAAESVNKDRFSSDNHTVASLADATLQTFPSRQTKIETLRQAVSISQYKLDTEKIASAIANLSI